jgi:hypothetical protein
MEVRGNDQRSELRERAIAARVAGATEDGWRDFMQLLDAGSRALGPNNDFIERVCKQEPKSNIEEGEIEWQKSN